MLPTSNEKLEAFSEARYRGALLCVYIYISNVIRDGPVNTLSEQTI